MPFASFAAKTINPDTSVMHQPLMRKELFPIRVMTACSISRCLICPADFAFGSIVFAPVVGLELLEEEAREYYHKAAAMEVSAEPNAGINQCDAFAFGMDDGGVEVNFGDLRDGF